MVKSEDERLVEEWVVVLGEDFNVFDIDVDEILVVLFEELKNMVFLIMDDECCKFDIIMDILVIILMEVGCFKISICNLL